MSTIRLPKKRNVKAEIREQQFPDVSLKGLWTGADEKGFFSVPRTLPLVLRLANALSGKSTDPTSVYLELLSRQSGEGIVVMGAEQEHAYAAGYTGNRATRTWRDRMKVLEELGFIRSKKRGPMEYGYVALTHPALAVERLREQGKVPDDWWSVYEARQMEVGETRGVDVARRLLPAAVAAES